MSMGGGSETKRSEQSTKGTHFPTGFVDDYTDYYGYGFTIPQLEAGVPDTANPFWGGQAAAIPAGAPGGMQPDPNASQTGAYTGPAVPGSGGYAPPPAQPAAPAAPRRYKVADIMAAWDNDPQKRMDVNRLIKKGYLKDDFTIEDLRVAVGKDKDLSGRSRGNFESAIALMQQRDDLLNKRDTANAGLPTASGQNPFAPVSTGSSPFGQMMQSGMEQFAEGPQVRVNQEMLGNFLHAGAPAPIGMTSGYGSGGAGGGGFSAAGGVATAGTVGAPGAVDAAQATAAQTNFSGGDYDAFQEDYYNKAFNPIARSMEQQYGTQRERMRSELAATGMLDAAPWTLQNADEEYARQRLGASEDASYEAAVQTFGYKFAEETANADRQQQTSLFNTGQTNTVRMENAKNLLTANITNAQLSTQASIASAGNQTQASIATAGNQTQAGIANLDASTRLEAARMDSDTRRSIANQQSELQWRGMQADTYLNALQIDANQEQAYRRDFLGMMGLAEQDLGRLDDYALKSTSLVYDTYLRQQAIIAGAGEYQQSRSEEKGPSGGGIGGDLLGRAIGAGAGFLIGGPVGAGVGSGIGGSLGAGGGTPTLDAGGNPFYQTPSGWNAGYIL